MISLYFHIPFCSRKCPYCHFYVIPNRALYHDILKEALALEWEEKLPLISKKKLTSIYFGGGTPSLFAPSGIEMLLAKIQETFSLEDVEITLEVNPENGSKELFSRLKKMGVNRLSIGVQSLDDSSLSLLERTHSAQKAKETIYLAKDAGFENISIDLMYDLPDQTLPSWEKTLKELEPLPIQHISLYNLTIEPHTSFYKRKKSLSFPSQKTSLSFLQAALDQFKKLQFERYEVSAFALKGYESKHNMGYWTARPFMGFGPSAFSFWEGERFRNMCNLNRYYRNLKEKKNFEDYRERLSYPRNTLEKLLVHLRLLEGVDKNFYGPLPKETEEELIHLKEEGLLHIFDERIQLSEKGLLFYDTIGERLI